MSNIIFNPSGRLGNAVFRYLGCIMYIKNNPKLIYILKKMSTNYTFYKGLDFIGNDIDFKPNNTHSECNNNIHANGYNTLGFIKQNIDIKKIVSNEYINDQNGHGLYVKNMIINDENYFEHLINIDKTIIMEGYCQYDNIYLENKEFILNFIDLHKNEHSIQTDRNDIYLMKEIMDDIILTTIYDSVIHIRLDDFNGRPDFIEIEYLINALEQAYTNNDLNGSTAIVIQPPTNLLDKQYLQKCLDWFKDKNLSIPIVESNNLMIDFNIMKQTKVLICSMSTLSWSAAYLSKTLNTCYMPNYNFSEDKERKYVTFKIPITNTILYNVKTTDQILHR